MRAVVVSVILTITSAGWYVTFTPHPLNVGVQLTTECRAKDGRLDFSAVDYVQVAPEDENLTLRRQTTPRGQRCTVVASVLRNADGATGDPDADYVGESSIIVDP